jgi:hypothetical protein
VGHYSGRILISVRRMKAVCKMATVVFGVQKQAKVLMSEPDMVSCKSQSTLVVTISEVGEANDVAKVADDISF